MTAEDNVALYAHAILTAKQFALEAGFNEVGSANEKFSQINETLNATTDLIEAALDRVVIYRGAATVRFYSPEKSSQYLVLDEWPIDTTSLTVHETTDRTYDATTLLNVNQDFIIENSSRETRLVRTLGSTGGPTTWTNGFRTIRVSAKEGFRRSDQAAAFPDAMLLPGDIRKVAARVAARIWAETKRQTYGVISKTDAAGTMTRFSESYITISDSAIIRNHARLGMGSGRKGTT